MAVTVSFEGGREFEAALADLGRSVGKRTAERALAKAAEPIRDEWVRLAPDDSGDLKKAIKIGRAVKGVQKRVAKDQAVRFVGIDESENRRLHIYAEVQEFGNASNPAQPAGRPAFERKKEEALARLADDLREEIQKTAERAARKSARLAKRGASLDANADTLRAGLGL
jgi:HK97 gp10 family phage protein